MEDKRWKIVEALNWYVISLKWWWDDDEMVELVVDEVELDDELDDEILDDKFDE